MAKLRSSSKLTKAKCKCLPKRSKVEKKAEKERKRDAKQELKKLLSSPIPGPIKDELIAEAERLVNEIRKYKSHMQQMEWNLKLIRKELKRRAMAEKKFDENHFGEGPSNAVYNNQPPVMNEKKKHIKRQKKKQRRIAAQVDNLIITLSDTILE